VTQPPARWTGIEPLVGRQVVLDLPGTLVYLGRLEAVRGDCLVLADADVHDTRDAHHTKEQYINEARRLGIRRNRDRVYVNAADVVSVSLLSDVVLD
jgi:hypothetical protein